MKKFLLGLILVSLFSVSSNAQNTLILSEQEQLYERAMDLFNKEKYNPARTSFETYHQTYEDERSIDAQYFSSLSALRLFHGDAIYKLLSFQNSYPNHPRSKMIDYELGNYFYQKNNFQEAVSYYRKVKMEDLPAEVRIESQFKMGYSYFNEQDFDEAALLFDASKQGSHKYTAAANYYSGVIAYKLSKYDKALKDLEVAAKDEAYDGIVPELLVNIYYKKGDFKTMEATALKVLESKATRNKNNIYLMLADAKFAESDYKSADKYFTQYADGKRIQSDPDIHYRMGITAFNLKKNEAAEENLKISAFKANDSIQQIASFYLGRTYLRLENATYAENAFEQATKFDFNPQIKEEALFAICKLTFDSKLRSKSIEPLKSYLDVYENGKFRNEANELLSQAFLTSNDYDAAIAHIESLKSRNERINQTYQKVTFYKGIERFNNQGFEDAVALFDKSLEHPFDQDIILACHFWQGEAYSIMRRYPEAVNAYARVFKGTDNDNSEFFLRARYGIGYAYYNDKLYDKALAHFKIYTDKLANASEQMYYGDALVRLADCYFVLKKNKLAFENYSKVSQVYEPARDYALYRLGVLSWFEGEKSKAQTFLSSMLKTYPDSRYRDDALFEFANIDYENGDFNPAVAGFEKLIKEEPKSPFIVYALLNKGIANANLEKYDPAIKDYRKILSQFPQHKVATDALVGLQEVLRLSGRDDEFDGDKAAFKEANPESNALVSLEFEGAKKDYLAGNNEKAIDKFGKYLNAYGKNIYYGDVNYYLGEAHYKLNHIDSALKYHNLVLKYINSEFLNRSILRSADLHYTKNEYAQAKANYTLLRHLAKSRNEQIFAWQGLMLSNYQTLNYDSVDIFAQLIIERGEASFGAENKALLYLGKSARKKGQFDKAFDYFEKTMAAGDDEHAAEAMFRTAEMQSELAEFKTSTETCLDLIARFGQYGNWNDAAFLRIAENFYQMEEYFQARSTLESIIANSPNSETVKRAKQLLKDVEQQETKIIANDSIE